MSLSFRVPIGPSLCEFQEVGASLELTFISCPHKSLSRYSLVCKFSFNAFVRSANMLSMLAESESFRRILAFSVFSILCSGYSQYFTNWKRFTPMYCH